MPKAVKRKKAKKRPAGGITEPRLIYLRFRIENHCRCGGTTEVVVTPGMKGWVECSECATYVPCTEKVATDLLRRYLR